MTKNIHFYRHYFFSDNVKLELCAQLQELPSINCMIDLVKPLIDEIGGKAGLFYTAWFNASDYERAKEYFESLGYTTSYSDEYKKDYNLHKLINSQ